MTFARALSAEKERELLVEYEDGWTIHELTIIYKVSTRTVYRILARNGVPLKNPKKKRKRRTLEPKPVVLKPCGTNAAYQRHRRNGEYPCTPCLEAHAQNVREAKAK